jgi:phage terminase large subunit-like protein
VVGLAPSGVAYVLEDLSGDLATDEWAAVTCGAYAGRLRHYIDEQLSEPLSDDLETIAAHPYPWRRADVIHAETNQGGDLIRNQLQSFGSNAAVNSTHTTQSKRVRAEPVHHLYQRGLVKHVGQLSTLEDQLTDFIQETENDSPDRADALVYAIHELMLDDISGLDSDHIIGLD